MTRPTLHPRTHVLPNGLTVLLDPFPRDAFVAWRVVVRAGAAFDPPGRSGVAHLLEHMLANKGTSRLGTRDWSAEAPLLDRIRQAATATAQAQGAERAHAAARLDSLEQEAWRFAIPGELKRAASLLGARGLNASTSQDRTWYRVNVPAHRLQQWARLDAERFRHPVVRTFATELSTVCEEKRRSDDSPSRATYGALQAALWGDHPYGRPVLGHTAELERLDVLALEGFLDRWYRPENMAVCLSGAFDADEALALLTETFGQLPAGPGAAHRLCAPPPLERQRIEVVHQDDAEVRLAWRTAPRSHADRAALQLLDEVLGNSATGLLARALVHTRQARSALSGRSAMRFGGALTLVGRPADGGAVEHLEEALLQVVSNVQAGRFSASDLAAMKRNAALSTQRALESIDNRVTWLARTATHSEPWPQAGRWQEQLDAVTMDDVVEVAQRYLGDNRVTLVRRRGAPTPTVIAPPAVTERPAPTPGESAFLRAVLNQDPPLPAAESLAVGRDLHDHAAPWGRLLSAGNPCNDLFHLTLVWNTGTDDRRGLGSAFGAWGLAGVGELDRSALEARLADLGVGISWQIRQRRSALSISGPEDAWDEAVALCAARLREPVVDADQLQRHLADRVQRRQEHKTNRNTLVGALNQRALYGDDSSYLGRSLTDDEVWALQEDALGDWTGPLLDASPTALFTGTLPPGAVARTLGVALPRPQPTSAVRPLRYVDHDQDRVWLLHHPGAQATVTVLQPVAPTSVDDAPRRVVLSQLWGGLGGVFFRTVREQRGWAYSVSGQASAGAWVADDGLRAASAATDPERAGATAALLVELLRHSPLQPEDIDRARASALESTASHRVRFRSIPATWLSWEQQGYDRDPRPARRAALERVTASSVSALRDAQSRRPVTVCIVGDLTRLDRGALAPLGTPQELQPASLFSY